jgi:hypothetical protein
MSARRVKRGSGPIGALSEVVRGSCTDCGGPVEWLGLGDAVDVLGVDLVNEFLDYLDWDGEEDLDFWLCPGCGTVGVLGDVEAG